MLQLRFNSIHWHCTLTIIVLLQVTCALDKLAISNSNNKDPGTSSATQQIQNVTRPPSRKTVKKMLKSNELPPPPIPTSKALVPHSDESGVVIALIPSAEHDITPTIIKNASKLPIENSNIRQQTFLPNDMDIPDAYKASFYFFFGISSLAVLFIIVRIYHLRLSRAERKYGVQGDRANQELTPLPMAIEDINSDEDDHTLFEINRQNIRIL